MKWRHLPWKYQNLQPVDNVHRDAGTLVKGVMQKVLPCCGKLATFSVILKFFMEGHPSGKMLLFKGSSTYNTILTKIKGLKV